MGSLNKIPVSFLGAILFKQIPSAWGIVGIIIGITGGSLYSLLRAQENSQKIKTSSSYTMKERV